MDGRDADGGASGAGAGDGAADTDADDGGDIDDDVDADGESGVPADHPRRESLVTRERIEAGVEAGITSRQGLVAQGRGEAFDYLLGEGTIPSADRAARAAAAQLLLAERPVLSVNGNVAALVPGEVVDLAAATGADIEVNLFHRTPDRVEAIADHLRAHGAEAVKGLAGDARIPGLSHDRARVDADGIAAADTVLVPLEDGDRAAALAALGKVEIVIDLNPLSRSARAAAIPIVDNVVRAVPNVAAHARDLADAPPDRLRETVRAFDADAARADAERTIREGIGRTGDGAERDGGDAGAGGR
ncbi:MAG: 4-phosphopantoate--beta-alanine ligase [Haloferacaceae archaeon]